MSDKSKKGRIAAGAEVKLRGLAGCKVLAYQPRLKKLSDDLCAKIEAGRKVFDYWTSLRDRYIVEVQRRGVCGPLPPAYYAPLAGALERENPQAKRSAS